MNSLIIYAETVKRANLWRQNYVTSAERSPIYASPETPNIFRGMRNMTIVIVGDPRIIDELHLCEGRNNIICVKE